MSAFTTQQAEKFLAESGTGSSADYEVRTIGTDEDMVNAVIYRISVGEKTMTYSLPWVAERTQLSPPVPGRHLIVLDARGDACLLLRLTHVERLLFGRVTEADIAREGVPMRNLEAWIPLHIAVWNIKLAPFGLCVSDETPVWAEYFDVVYLRPGEYRKDTKYG